MAIEKKTVAEVSPGARNVYQKAASVFAKNSVEYAIELLKSVVQKEPGFIDARNMLREAERRYSASLGKFARFVAGMKQMPLVTKGRSVLKKNPELALSYAEEALSYNFLSRGPLNLLIDAGKACEAPFIQMEGLEGIVELDDKNEANMKTLAEVYEANGEGAKVLRIRQMIAAKHPDSLEAQANLRAAAALASMEQNKANARGNDKGGMYKKTDATADLLRDDRIVRSEEDIRKMIEYYEGLIASGDTSIDNRRKLAEFYQRVAEYQKTIDTYNWIVERLGTLDPNIDKAIEFCTIQIKRQEITKLQEAGAAQDQVDAIEAEINAYRLERAEYRIKTYPNDTLMRYEAAVVYWDLGNVEKALEQFQLAQRNPHKRLAAIAYLGRCFAAKEQFDMAIEQFEKAVKEMPAMDDLKMETVYHLGITYDTIGESEKALNCFKDIYAVNVGYEDVGKRIDDYYARKRAEKQNA
ncbi:MAG: hypothetical protein E7040_03685 [Lentisphaerae bacterium]|nr:hypothetical protein [Lentisphaerota bacterium]